MFQMVSDSDLAWQEHDSAIEAGEEDAEAGTRYFNFNTPDAPHIVTEFLLTSKKITF